MPLSSMLALCIHCDAGNQHPLQVAVNSSVTPASVPGSLHEIELKKMMEGGPLLVLEDMAVTHAGGLNGLCMWQTGCGIRR